MRKNCVHYVASNDALGTSLERFRDRVCPEKSAGHIRHEYTTGCAYPEIVK
jgi:hypothetical protein